MNPLTLDCARARQQLDQRLEGPLLPEDEADLQGHLSRCTGCQQARIDLDQAMAALASLSPDDLERLRVPIGDRELDTSSLTGALAVGLAIAVVIGLAFLFALHSKAPTKAPAPPPPVTQAPAIPIPSVGGMLGAETDPTYEMLAEPLPGEPAEGPAVEADPAEVVVAVAPPQPADPALRPIAKQPAQPAPAKPAKKKPAAPKKPAAKPLPKAALAQLARLQLSDGLRYRGVSFYFLRDPNGRKRLSGSRSQGLPSVRESRPRKATQVVVRRPGSRNQAYVLLGEVLEAPSGPRIATTTRRLYTRSAVAVEAIRYDPLARRNPKPLLKGPLLLPSNARLALILSAQPGPVALLLQSLTDSTFKDLERMRIELGELEAEAREVERRIRAIVGDTRGLRGVGISVGGQARSVDLFGSARLLTASLGKLIRTALLEERLSRPYDHDNAVDPRPTGIERGVTDTKTAHRSTLKLLARATQAKLVSKAPRREINGRFESRGKDGSAAVLLLRGDSIVHGVIASPSGVRLTKR